MGLYLRPLKLLSLTTHHPGKETSLTKLFLERGNVEIALKITLTAHVLPHCRPNYLVKLNHCVFGLVILWSSPCMCVCVVPWSLTLLRLRSPMLRASCWISVSCSASRFCSFNFSARVSSSVRASCSGSLSWCPTGVFFSMSCGTHTEMSSYIQ